MICLHVIWKAHAACNFKYLFENEGLLKDTASYVLCICDNILETVWDSRCYCGPLIECDIWTVEYRQFRWLYVFNLLVPLKLRPYGAIQICLLLLLYLFHTVNCVSYPQVPQRVTENAISRFLAVKFNFCWKKSAAKFFFLKTSRGRVVAT